MLDRFAVLHAVDYYAGLPRPRGGGYKAMKAAQEYNPSSTGSARMEALGLQRLLEVFVLAARLSPEFLVGKYVRVACSAS